MRPRSLFVRRGTGSGDGFGNKRFIFWQEKVSSTITASLQFASEGKGMQHADWDFEVALSADPVMDDRHGLSPFGDEAVKLVQDIFRNPSPERHNMLLQLRGAGTRIVLVLLELEQRIHHRSVHTRLEGKCRAARSYVIARP
jgi:hypothetical protein